MSKTLKDGKAEKAKIKPGEGKKWTRRPKVQEKGGHKSIREIVDDGD